MKNIIYESFELNFKIMEIFGWFSQKEATVFYKIKSLLLYFGLLLTYSVLCFTSIILEKSYNAVQFIFVAECISYCLKLVPFCINQGRLNKCIMYFGDPYFLPRNEEESKILALRVNVCRKLSLGYFLGVNVFCLFCFVAKWLFFAQKYELPMQVWLPYNVTSSMKYYPTCIYIVTATGYAGCASSLIDPLIGGLAFHISGQYQILKHRLLNLNNDGKNMDLVYENLSKCVELHNAILRFIEEYEKCFSWIIFSQFFGTTLSLCYCSILLLMVPVFSLDGIMCVAFYVNIFWQVFFYCFFGTLVFDESNSLITSIYMTNWYEYNTKVRKLLIIMMQGAQHPYILKTQKFIPLTLETLSKMLKSSYSMIAVLKKQNF